MASSYPDIDVDTDLVHARTTLQCRYETVIEIV